MWRGDLIAAPVDPRTLKPLPIETYKTNRRIGAFLLIDPLTVPALRRP
jgi:hypothetical protein